jgi:hypothetical protein
VQKVTHVTTPPTPREVKQRKREYGEPSFPSPQVPKKKKHTGKPKRCEECMNKAVCHD